MDFTANYNTPIDMRTFRIQAKNYGPSDVSWANRRSISLKDGTTYYGQFSFNKQGKTLTLNWKRSTLTGFHNSAFKADDLSISGKTYLKAAKRNDGKKLRAIALAGDDTITGSRFADILTGETGNDRIEGMAGDVLIGGPGADVFVPQESIVADFNPAEGDRLQVWHQPQSRAFAPLLTAVDGGGVRVQMPNVATDNQGNAYLRGHYSTGFVLQSQSTFDWGWVF